MGRRRRADCGPKPYNRDGTVKRGEYLIGLNVLALKFRAAGFALDPTVIDWLHTLNRENLSFYEKASNRGNLRVWAAAGAALFALIQPDAGALGFQDQVWHEAMAAIHDDGTIDAELARGQRALIYHMFSFSAALVLHAAREGLGYRDTPADTARLKLLADMIGQSLCDPKPFAARAQANQEIPGDWAYRVPLGFGVPLSRRQLDSMRQAQCRHIGSNLRRRCAALSRHFGATGASAEPPPDRALTGHARMKSQLSVRSPMWRQEMVDCGGDSAASRRIKKPVNSFELTGYLGCGDRI